MNEENLKMAPDSPTEDSDAKRSEPSYEDDPYMDIDNLAELLLSTFQEEVNRQRARLAALKQETSKRYRYED